MLKNCRDLKIWQESYQLCLEIYKLTKIFPKNEGFGFTSQVKRAALSIPSNISDGCRRKTPQNISKIIRK
ncbi:MAG: four helix bundle protein [Deltaproteobacteria bacterium]|nr:four helix bundle protein [Deltaproteobacteria bacterium]MBW2144805.1 four helix bundle protein [Deltaproteobacteria bacterium]